LALDRDTINIVEHMVLQLPLVLFLSPPLGLGLCHGVASEQGAIQFAVTKFLATGSQVP
jgi:hypothetical protein